MDMKKLAAEIVQRVGGKENIKNVTHCVTRLRFVVKDEKKSGCGWDQEAERRA